jgi:hypothetical protein
MHSVTLFLVGVGVLGLSPVLLGVVYVIRRASDARRDRGEHEDLPGEAAE